MGHPIDLNPEQAESLIKAARNGCPDALGRLIEGCRAYLVAVAKRTLSPSLRTKLSGADLVQETALEAQQHIDKFVGDDLDQFLAWMRQILLHNVSNAHRHYKGTQKRRVTLETSLESSGSALRLLQDQRLMPEQIAESNEMARIVEDCLLRLPTTLREVIILRNREFLSFSEIGVRIGRSTAASRKLWARGIERLDLELRGNPAGPLAENRRQLV
jgi:RNA polymerase sigma-70 factor, ECF subfamily